MMSTSLYSIRLLYMMGVRTVQRQRVKGIVMYCLETKEVVDIFCMWPRGGRRSSFPPTKCLSILGGSAKGARNWTRPQIQFACKNRGLTEGAI